MQEAPRLLVVGGSGFIGRHVVNAAIGRGWRVTSLSLSGRMVDESQNVNVRRVAADMTDLTALRGALDGEGFEYVVNCGGYIDHAPLGKGGRKVAEAHFEGVVNLVTVLARSTLRGFVSIGSSDEYGDAPAPQRESRREAPISAYSCAKVACAHFLQMVYRTEDFPAATLRLFLTYGPGQDDRRFLPQIIRACVAGKPFPASEGHQLRDFCFVQDTVEAIFAALESPAARGEVINVASGKPVSIRQVIETVRELVGGGKPLYGQVPYRRGENMELFADTTKAKSILNWEPKTALALGLKRTIEWVSGQN